MFKNVKARIAGYTILLISLATIIYYSVNQTTTPQLAYQLPPTTYSTANNCGGSDHTDLCAGYNVIGSSAQFHVLAINTTGTVTTCAGQVDTSSNGSTWTLAALITSQNCGANTNSITYSGSSIVNYVRVNVTTLTGGGAVVATLTGYINSPFANVSGIVEMPTTAFSGGDFGTRAANCFVNIFNVNNPGGICNGRGETGSPDMLVDPFLASQTPLAPTLLMPCTNTTTEVGIPITNGTPGANNGKTHGNSTMIGCTKMGSAASASQAVSGSTLTAGPNFPICQSNLAVGSLNNICTRFASATVTTSFGVNGQFNNIVKIAVGGSGFVFATSNIGEEIIVGTSTANYTYGIITAILTTTSGCSVGNPCAQVVGGLGSTTPQAATSFIIKACLTCLGVDSQSSAGNSASYAISVSGMTLDCNSVPGCDTGANWYSVEKSGYSNIQMQGYLDIGLDLEGNQSQTGGPYEHLFMTSGFTCDTNVLDIVARGSNLPRIIDDVSVAGSHGCPTAANPQLVSFAIDTGLTTISQIHGENKVKVIALGEGPACPIVCPEPVQGTLAGVVITNVHGSCSNFSVGPCTSVLDIGTNSTVVNLVATSIAQSVANMTNTIVDNINSCSETDNSVAQYIIGRTSQIFSSSGSHCGLTGTTASITGTALSAGACDTGTATVTGAKVGAPVLVSTTDGTIQAGSFTVFGSVTSANTVTVNVCAAVAGTPASKAYNVKVNNLP